MRWRTPSNASWMPRCARPSRSRRSASPSERSNSTLGCSRTPARTRCSTYARSALLEHDAVDADRREQVGEHEPGRTGADDRHLGLVAGHAANDGPPAAVNGGGTGRGAGAWPVRARARATDTMNAVATTSHSTSSTSSTRRQHGPEPAARRLARHELDGRRGAVHRCVPDAVAVLLAAVRVLDVAGQRGAQLHARARSRAWHRIPRCRRRTGTHRSPR